MARYLLVAIDENDRADKLIPKLDSLRGVTCVALYGKPTKFCDDSCQTDVHVDNRRSIFGARFGWALCPVCHKPRKRFHTFKNLIQLGDLPVRFRDEFLELRIKEPWNNDPVEKYGQAAIDGQRKINEAAAEKMARYRARDTDAQRERRKASRDRRKQRKLAARNSA